MRRLRSKLIFLVVAISLSLLCLQQPIPVSCSSSSNQFAVDGKVLELDDKNFDAAIAFFDFILVDFYAPWCGHCKRLNPELDAAAPVLAGLEKPIVIAKVNADKFRSLTTKYEIDGFPTLKIFTHGFPVEYTGPRKAELLVRFLKKFVAPDVSLLESDSAISNFIEMAGTHFPIFIGFGLNESVISELAIKYKRKAWFSVAKDFSEDIMVTYDFDKVPALVSLHPSYNERSVFYGPFEGVYAISDELSCTTKTSSCHDSNTSYHISVMHMSYYGAILALLSCFALDLSPKPLVVMIVILLITYPLCMSYLFFFEVIVVFSIYYYLLLKRSVRKSLTLNYKVNCVGRTKSRWAKILVVTDYINALSTESRFNATKISLAAEFMELLSALLIIVRWLGIDSHRPHLDEDSDENSQIEVLGITSQDDL